jgi:Holliday junction resolvase RusA-like endonuclease
MPVRQRVAPASAADFRVVFDVLGKLTGASHLHPEAIGFVHPGTPIPKARARWSPKSGSWYTPSTTKVAEEAVAWCFKQALGRRPPFRDTVAIVALFYVPTLRRKDTDNLMKLLMDAGNQSRIWKDDADVIAQAVFLELDRERPRTIVAVWPYLGTRTRAPLFHERTSDASATVHDR